MNTPNSTATRWLAALGWGLAIAASSGVFAVMHWGAGVLSDRYANTAIAGPYSALVLWCGIPVALATVAFVAILAGTVRFALPPIGALVLLTIGAAFSFGRFFVPSTGLLLVAALLLLSEQKDRWTLAMSWLWLLVGAAALLPFLALLTTLLGSPTTLPTGLTFFGVTVGALVIFDVPIGSVCEGASPRPVTSVDHVNRKDWIPMSDDDNLNDAISEVANARMVAYGLVTTLRKDLAASQEHALSCEKSLWAATAALRRLQRKDAA